MEYTYHNLPPSKYSVLLLYYTVLQQCADRGAQLKASVVGTEFITRNT